MRSPSIHYVEDVRKMNLNNSTHALIDGQWFLARPLGFCNIWERIRVSWLVFTGRADALIWPGGQ